MFTSPPLRSRSAPEIAYRVRPGGPETVVLLHGVGSSSATWRGITPLLDPRYRLVMPDYRGHGDSVAPPPPYEVADFVADLFRVLDELEIDTFHLVGFSIGAIFAQAATLSHPDRVSSLVLLNPTADRTDDERTRAAKRLQTIRSSDPSVVATTSVERWFTAGFIASHPNVVAAEVAIFASTAPESYAAAYQLLAAVDLIDDVEGIHCPTLIVTGENDRGSTPRMSRAIHERLLGSQLVIVDGRQHYLHIEVAQTIADLINGFLASHSTPHH